MSGSPADQRSSRNVPYTAVANGLSKPRTEESAAQVVQKSSVRLSSNLQGWGSSLKGKVFQSMNELHVFLLMSQYMTLQYVLTLATFAAQHLCDREILTET